VSSLDPTVSVMNQLKALLKRLAPSSPALITGAATSGILYVANHVFHVHLLAGRVEDQLAPLMSFLLASVAHNGAKFAPRVVAEVTKVEGQGDGVIKAVAPSSTVTTDGLVGLVASAITSRLTSDPTLQDRLVKEALAHLLPTAPVAPPAPAVIPAPRPRGCVDTPAPVKPDPVPDTPTSLADVQATDPAALVVLAEAPHVIAPTPLPS
jgi:hypothetical protein